MWNGSDESIEDHLNFSSTATNLAAAFVIPTGANRSGEISMLEVIHQSTGWQNN